MAGDKPRKQNGLTRPRRPNTRPGNSLSAQTSVPPKYTAHILLGFAREDGAGGSKYIGLLADPKVEKTADGSDLRMILGLNDHRCSFHVRAGTPEKDAVDTGCNIASLSFYPSSFSLAVWELDAQEIPAEADVTKSQRDYLLSLQAAGKLSRFVGFYVPFEATKTASAGPSCEAENLFPPVGHKTHPASENLSLLQEFWGNEAKPMWVNIYFIKHNPTVLAGFAQAFDNVLVRPTLDHRYGQPYLSDLLVVGGVNEQLSTELIKGPGERPRITGEPIKRFCSRKEMFIRLAVGCMEQMEMDRAANVDPTNTIILRCFRESMGKDTEYPGLLEFGEQKMPEFRPGARVQLTIPTLKRPRPGVIAQALTGPSQEIKLTTKYCRTWHAVVQPPEYWQPANSVLVMLKRPQYYSGKYSQERIPCYYPTDADDQRDIQQIFSQAPKAHVSLKTSYSDAHYKRILGSLDVLMKGTRKATSRDQAVVDKVNELVDNDELTMRDLGPVELLEVSSARRNGEGDGPDDARFLDMWSRIFCMTHPNTGHRSDLFFHGKSLGPILTMERDSDHIDVVNYLSNATPLAIVMGYPGTGKTTFMADILGVLAENKDMDPPIVVAAPSNVATNVLAEKLFNKNAMVVRVHKLQTENEYIYNSHREEKKGSKSSSGWAEPADDDIFFSDKAYDLDDGFDNDIRYIMEVKRWRKRSPMTPNLGSDEKPVYVSDTRFKHVKMSLGWHVMKIAGFPGFPKSKHHEFWKPFREGALALVAHKKLSDEEFRRYSEQKKMIVEYTLRVASVVITTISNLAMPEMIRALGDASRLCFIDEAGLASKGDFAIPIAHYSFEKVVLWGDVQQLSPVIRVPNDTNSVAYKDPDLIIGLKTQGHYHYTCSLEFGQSILQAFVDSGQHYASLTQQRRSVAGAMDIASKLCYNGKLVDHKERSDPSNHRLSKNIRTKLGTLFTDNGELPPPTMVIEVAGSTNVNERKSLSNKENATVGINFLKYLLDSCTIHSEQVGVICTYLAQVYEWKRQLDVLEYTPRANGHDVREVTVATVDSFQGDEREFMIVDLVVVNSLGFLKEPRRLNVAITRLKEAQIILGPPRDWVDYFNQWDEKDLKKDPVAFVMHHGKWNDAVIRVDGNNRLLEQNVPSKDLEGACTVDKAIPDAKRSRKC